MAAKRHFLGWDGPLTPRVVEFLARDAARGPLLDLAATLVVVPTRQAGRRLREALALRAAASGGAVLSLQAVTSGALLDLGQPREGVADPAVAAAVWARALAAAAPGAYPALFPQPPPPDDERWALGAVRLLQRARSRLAESGLTTGDVPRLAGAGFEDADRWRDFERLERAAYEALDALRLRDPVEARRRAALAVPVPEGIRRVVVAAVPDPPPLALRVLERWAETVDVDILVHAPAGRAGDFDAWGRPSPAAWSAARIDVPDGPDELIVAATPAAQAREVVRLLAEARGRFAPRETAIGVPGPEVAPELEVRLAEAGLKVFDPAPVPLARHPLSRLVEDFLGLSDRNGYASLSAFLRHPDVLDRLRDAAGVAPCALLERLDRFQNRHLPAGYDEVAARVRTQPPGGGDPLAAAIGWLAPHAAELREGSAASAVRGLLRDVYRDRRLRRGRPDDDLFVAAAEAVDGLLHGCAAARERGVARDPAEERALLRDGLAQETLTREPRGHDLDLDGWLELPWNDARLLVVTGLNEGSVPDGRPEDAFLPDATCARLGLRTDASRFARDAFLLTTLVESRRRDGAVRLLLGQRSAGGDPLRPSRLLFRCPDAALARRARRLLAPARDPRVAQPFAVSFALDPSRPALRPAPPPTRLRVTSLRDYLACPFRFYLRHVLGMEAVDDRRSEPEAAEFGELVHEALRTVAADPRWSRCDDEGELARALGAAAGAWVRDRYGARPGLPVLLALESAQQRLARAAGVEVRLRREGWETVLLEEKRTLALGGMSLTGTIDRVDVHRASGRWRVIDYKSSDRAEDPADRHLGAAGSGAPGFARVEAGGRTRRWLDLQLPLYAAMLGPDAPPDRVEVAYLNLPKALGDTALVRWEGLDPALLQSARACATAIAERVAAGVFWPPSARVKYDEFEGLWFGDPAACFREPSARARGAEVRP